MLINEYECIIGTQEEGILSAEFHQGMLFKRFKVDTTTN